VDNFFSPRYVFGRNTRDLIKEHFQSILCVIELFTSSIYDPWMKVHTDLGS